MKILCIGRNYADHVREFGNAIPEKPVLFLKPETALRLPGQPVHLHPASQQLQAEAEVVLRLAVALPMGKALPDEPLFDAVTLGIDLTARDLQTDLKSKGLPWELSKAFDGSAWLGTWLPAPPETDLDDLSFELTANGQTVQRSSTRFWMFGLRHWLTFATGYFSLQPGDVLFTGTPASAPTLQPHMHLQGSLQGRTVLDVVVNPALPG